MKGLIVCFGYVGVMILAGLVLLTHPVPTKARPDNAARIEFASYAKDKYADEFKSHAPVQDDSAEHPGYSRRGFGIVLNNGMTRCPRYVMERVTTETLEPIVPRKDAFKSDKNIPAEFRPVPSDYLNTEFDKGHQAASVYHRLSEDEQAETFLMTNMIPQHKKVNEQIWRFLEDGVKKFAADNTVVWVCTVPVWKPDSKGVLKIQTIGKNNVWVPTHCCKAVLIERPRVAPEARCWMVENVVNPKQDFDFYEVVTDQGETDTGLNFWPFLDESVAREIESRKF